MAKAKLLTAEKVFKYLSKLKAEGNDLKKITINFREDRNSDVHSAIEVEEDLFDAKTNNELESIVFLANTDEV
jgi:hypothetical protein